jgi:hypothetical protein
MSPTTPAGLYTNCDLFATYFTTQVICYILYYTGTTNCYLFAAYFTTQAIQHHPKHHDG